MTEKKEGLTAREQVAKLTMEQAFIEALGHTHESLRVIGLELLETREGLNSLDAEQREKVQQSAAEAADGVEATITGMKAGLLGAVGIIKTHMLRLDACLECQDRTCLDDLAETRGLVVGHGKPGTILQ